MNLFKRKLTAFTAMLAFLSLSSAATFALDTTDANVLGKTGNIGFDHSMGANRTDINITDKTAGSVGQVDWKEFSVASNEHVNFGFSGLSQTIINRVLGGKTSNIMGKMTSSCIGSGSCEAYNNTGKVIFINPAGVLFGQGSQVDINSLTVSTFDMQGARNLQGMSAADMANYQNNVLDRASALRNQIIVNGKTYNQGQVTLDSNYQDAFNTANNGAPIQYASNATKDIELNGATFSHWARANGQFDFNTELAESSPNKSLAFVSNNIRYTDSMLKTGLNYNYVATRSDGTKVPYSQSNVKLITADGVTFDYVNNGYIDGHTIAAEDNHPDIARTITMNNSGLPSTQAAITSGDIAIEQRAGKANGNQPSVKIKDTIVRGVKLVNWENGEIKITANQDIAIDHSRLETDNTTVVDAAGNTQSTVDRRGGEVKIVGSKNIDIENSTIITSGSKGTAANSENSGAVTIASGTGTTKINGSKILSDGHTKISSNNKVDVNNSMLQAYNTTDTTTEKNLTIVGANEVKINNTDMNSKGDLTIMAGDLSTGKLTGDVTITANGNKTIAENDPNQPVIESKKALKIQGKNTTISNTTLAYDESAGLKFYDSTKSGADYVNNVTIKDNTAFSPVETGTQKIAKDVTIETNGNLTFDNATAQRAEYAINFDRKNAQGETGYNLPATEALNDDGSIDGIHYITKDNPVQQDAVNLNIKSTQGNVTVTNGSNINAKNNSTVTANNGTYTQDKASTMSAGNDITITAKADTVKEASKVQGGRNASVTATTGDINVNNSQVLAKTNNASLTAAAGKINVTNSSLVEAANDANVKASGNVTIDNSQVVAGSDAPGFDVAYDANDNIGDANIESTNGTVYVVNNSKTISQDKDVNITSKNGVKFGPKGGTNVTIDKTADITAEQDVNIKSTNGNIEGEKTTMPTIKYGDRLTFDAAKSNIFTSQDSLKSVNVDYKAGESNRIYTTGDAQFVNSSFESPENFVESGKDVILNNLEIKDATANPKDTVTEIYANGNVTTYNVTGENLGAKDLGDYHTYPQEVSVDRVAKGDKTMPQYVDTLDSTTLDLNDTKLKVTTDTVKDDLNPDNGSITLVLQNADNPEAGIELTARNVDRLKTDSKDGLFKEGYYKTGDPQWDNDINPTQGPEIVVDSADGQLAIKDLYSDKLTLDPNDKFFADTTGERPTITVLDQGGFNLDPEYDYTKDPDGNKIGDGYTYDQTIRYRDRDVSGGILDMDEWPQDWTLVKEETLPDGTVVKTFEKTRDGEVTDTIIVKIDQEHKITFDNDGNPSAFTLVYDKHDREVIDGYPITAQQVKEDPSILDIVKHDDGTPATPDDFIKTYTDEDKCNPEQEVDRRPDDEVSLISLPREQVEISYTSTVADNTADQTSNIMSAAAKVSVQDVEATFDDEDDDADDSNN